MRADRARRFGGLIGILGLLAGCASISPSAQDLLRRWPVDRAPRLELETVAFRPQVERDHCGPSALATVLADFPSAPDPDALAPELFVPQRAGTFQSEMLAAARRHGAVAVRLPATLDGLVDALLDGYAPVVLLNLGLQMAPRWHYAVVVGLDVTRREVVMRSGSERRVVMPLATFEHTWARGGNWAFAVSHPGRLPAPVQRAEAVDATLAFSRVALDPSLRSTTDPGSSGPDASRAAWSALQARWPDDLTAVIGLSEGLMQRGRPEDRQRARDLLEQTARRTDRAVAWNNLADTLRQMGELEAAAAAIAQALRVTEHQEPQWQAVVEQTRDEIEGERQLFQREAQRRTQSR